jgi:hypothetical protein
LPKTEIDEELIEAYKDTVSLPFTAGSYNRITVKILMTGVLKI